MDMLPPQAPPALFQATNQEAVDALGRLIDTQDWLAEQSRRAPGLPVIADERSRDAFLAAMGRYWADRVPAAPGMPTVAREEALATRLAMLMRDDATLRHLDGTLDSRTQQLVASVTRPEGDITAPSIRIREVMFGDVPYAGALALTDDSRGGLSALFLPDRGWEAYESVEAMQHATESVVRARLALTTGLPGIMDDDMERAATSAFVSVRDIEGNAFVALAARIVALQRERMTAAWDGVDDTADPGFAAGHIAEQLAHAQQLDTYLDVRSLGAWRDRRMAVHLREEKLAQLPPQAAQDWRDAAHSHAVETAVAVQEQDRSGLTDIVPLRDFVRQMLQARLRVLGIQDDPDDITVSIYPMPDIGTPWATWHALLNGIEPPSVGKLEEKKLTDLALRNIGFLDAHSFRASGSDGRRLAPALDHDAIKRLVRQTNAAGRYHDYLMAQLVTSPDAALRRNTAVRVLATRMRLHAENARAGYFLPTEPRSLIDDRDQRGYQWIKAVLDAPEASLRRRIGGHVITVSHVMYGGFPLRDVLLIGTRSPQSVPRVVMYTPDAPDGIAFREFADRREAGRQFLYAARFEPYLLDRLPHDVARVEANGQRHFRSARGDERANWALFSADPAAVRTGMPFTEQEIAGDALHASYAAAVSLVTRNLESAARSTAVADADNVVPDLDGEAIGRSIAGFLGRPAQSAWRAYDEIKAGAHAQGFVDLVDAYVSSLDLLPVGVAMPTFPRAVATARRGALPTWASTGRQLRDPGSAFDDRFVARHVSTQQTGPATGGVYSLDGRHYIKQGGTLYGVRRDGQAWRLYDPETPTLAPFIRRNADGSWERLGLRGGHLPPPPPSPPKGGASDFSYHRDLSSHQRSVLRTHLRVHVGRPRSVRIMDYMVYDRRGPAPTPLVRDDVRAWREAVAAARRAPMVRADVAARQAARADAWVPPPTLQEVPQAEWPAAVYHYHSQGMPFPGNHQQRMTIAAEMHATAGAVGVGVLPLGPMTPWPALRHAMDVHGLGRGAAPPVLEWVRIDLDALRTRVDANGVPQFRLFRLPGTTTPGYLIRPAGNATVNPTLVLEATDATGGVSVITGPAHH